MPATSFIPVRRNFFDILLMLVWRCSSPPGSGIRKRRGVEFGYISELGRDPAAAYASTLRSRKASPARKGT